MRILMRRFKRLTNALSKNADNLKTVVALHFDPYDFVRMHKTFKTPTATETGVDNRVKSIGDLTELAN